MKRLLLLLLLLSQSVFAGDAIFAGATNRNAVISTIAPLTNDGAALGTSSLSFSDLFLASGGVINWNAGDVTLTHSSNTLTLGGTSDFDLGAAKLQTDNYLRFDTGVAFTGLGSEYAIGRNSDGTNGFQINVPTGALFEVSGNDVALLTTDTTNGLRVAGNASIRGASSNVALTLNVGAGLTTSLNIIEINVPNMTNTMTGNLTTAQNMVLGQKSYAGSASGRTIGTAINLDALSPTTSGANQTITSIYSGRFGSGGSTLVSASGANYHVIDIPAQTLTLTGTTQVTATPGAAGIYLGQITVSDASAVTMDSAASIYSAAAPVGAGAGPATLTNTYNLWTAAGTNRMDFSGSTAGMLLDLNHSATARINGGAILDLRSSGNFTFGSTDTYNEILIAPSGAGTESAGIGAQYWNGITIDMTNAGVVAGGGSAHLAALTLIRTADADPASNVNLKLGLTGVTLADDGDGAITFKSLGDGNMEDLTVNLDDTSNTAVVTSSTGVTNIDFGTIDIETDSINASGSTINYNDVNILELAQEDLTVGSCTVGQFKFDTGGAADEFCYCYATNTWACWAPATVNGPSD